MKHVFPTCQITLDFIGAACRPSPLLLSSPTPPSTTSSRSQWALPDLNRERQISVGTAGPQLISVQWALPLPSQISGGGIPASQGFRGAFAELSQIFGSHL